MQETVNERGNAVPEIDTVLEQADQIATQLVALALPVELRVAETAAHLTVAFQMRYQAIIERGWMRPEDFPDGLERDHHDDEAIHILAWEGDLAVGVARVVLPRQGRRLPTEEGFDLTVEPQGEVADWGRNIVSRDYTGAPHRLFAALLAKSWLEMRAHGYNQVCGNASAAVIRLYRHAANIEVHTIGPARIYWGERRYPFRFDFLVTGHKVTAQGEASARARQTS